MAEIQVVESKVFIRDLMLEDRDAALLLSDLEPKEREDAALTALRLGFLMYRHARIGVNVDFVRREFDEVVTEIKNYWRDEVVKNIDRTVEDHFDLEKGTVPRKLAEYFGDGTKTGKLAELFDEKKTTSVTYQLRQMIQQELTGENSSFIKALDPDDEKTPIGRLKKRIEKPIEDLRRDVIKEVAAAEMAETGTQKGGPYEDLTYTYVDRIAAAFRDVAVDVSSQNVSGDYVITLDAEAVPGQTLTIAIDAKDKKMGLKECETTLAEAKAKWGAQVALLVFARQDETPFFEVAYLDSAYRLLRDGVETLAEGTIDRAAVYPRRVVEAALKRGAAALVLAHNHPNGNITPSEYDKVLTRAIVLATETVHLRVVDHLIVSAQETFSFRKAGLL